VTARVNVITTHQVAFETPLVSRDGLGGRASDKLSTAHHRHGRFGPRSVVDFLEASSPRLPSWTARKATSDRADLVFRSRSKAVRRTLALYFSGGEACPFCFAQSARASRTIMAAGI
jgi:hypothetical protein